MVTESEREFNEAQFFGIAPATIRNEFFAFILDTPRWIVHVLVCLRCQERWCARDHSFALDDDLPRSAQNYSFTTPFFLNAPRNALRAEYAKPSPRKLRPRFLLMQIAGTSNDDPMPWAQIDGAPIFLSSFLLFCLPLSISLALLSHTSSPFDVPAILSRYELTRAFGCKASRITLLRESPLTVLHRRRAHFYRESEKNRRVKCKVKVAVGVL